MCAVSSAPDFTAALPAAAREVDDFVATGGWDQPPQLFALVPTAALLEQEPELADSLDPDAMLTPIAQESLPDGDLGTALARIVWPAAVQGCVVTQEIVVLPPEAEDQLNGAGTDPEETARIAAEHPDRREARLVAAVLRDGTGACVLRVRKAPDGPGDELVEQPDLAPNLLEALRQTFQD
ncbi:PPA1309 family protein [Crossiella sp. CA-258035]|uniref:PPA1309 family protein n=1 Tax=Crossiella sp. CA-258035 TaxID=2981138 RepID=UPI0024BC8908|nr:PPA1309 family protein [Crossiella sp. CA-258035]WHT18458.1 PPA1309 family protein [Crossiella sp. CA-258035]